MNIVLFGAPGSGKGTQSAKLVKQMGMFQISTGDLFRAAIKNRSALGIKAQKFMDEGALVPDSVVIAMVDEVLSSSGENGFILDGFPRTVAQAEALRSILSARNIEIDKVIFLEVPKEVLMLRLSGRRVCKVCGAVYHIASQPSQKTGICDKCNGELVQRNDDMDAVIHARLKTYEENTFPLKAYYKSMGKYVEIDANQEAGKVFELIENVMSK